MCLEIAIKNKIWRHHKKSRSVWSRIMKIYYATLTFPIRILNIKTSHRTKITGISFWKISKTRRNTKKLMKHIVKWLPEKNISSLGKGYFTFTTILLFLARNINCMHYFMQKVIILNWQLSLVFLISRNY